jgi:hypothetical protein
MPCVKRAQQACCFRHGSLTSPQRSHTNGTFVIKFGKQLNSLHLLLCKVPACGAYLRAHTHLDDNGAVVQGSSPHSESVSNALTSTYCVHGEQVGILERDWRRLNIPCGIRSATSYTQGNGQLEDGRGKILFPLPCTPYSTRRHRCIRFEIPL